jgi:hypothetical protein
VREEWFEPDSTDEALARFDALTASAPPARRRPVRPNAATRNAERFDAAVAARDLAAIAELYPESSQTLHHPTGVAYDRDGMLTSVRGLITGYEGFVRREEPLATLGESLGLFRVSLLAEGFRDDRFDVGASERETINLIEVDARGLRVRTEIFAADRLGEPCPLYERHAELLSRGERPRRRQRASWRSSSRRLAGARACSHPTWSSSTTGRSAWAGPVAPRGSWRGTARGKSSRAIA